MELFIITLRCVATMLLYAIPGFIGIKVKLWKPEHIPQFAFFLMYVASPALNIDAFVRGDFNAGDIGTCLAFFGIGIFVQFTVMIVSFLALRHKYADVRYKVLTLATTLGNCGFMGIPLLRAVLPEYPLAVPLSIFFSLGMNILIYTMGFFIISGDRRYASLRQTFLNPATISTLVGFGLFLLQTLTPFRMPTLVVDACASLGAISTPLCLVIIGMRLATVTPRQLFGEPVVYLAILVKQLLVPLIVYAILAVVPLDPNFEKTLFIMTAVPVASMILNATEILHAGQKEAASTILLSTISSIVTIPLLMLLP
ncbi:MAG: AEC family transporter [Clostridia bacterium]|nr:AEC family transporter [Clostridia bacterium]